MGSLVLWALRSDDSREFQCLVYDALCVLELDEGQVTTSARFTTTKTHDSFQVGVQNSVRGPVRFSITGSQGVIASATTDGSRFGLGLSVPAGTYEVTLDRQTTTGSVLVVIAGEKPTFTTGWQIVSRIMLALVAASGLWALATRRSGNPRHRAGSAWVFGRLLLAVVVIAVYLLAHEGGHALAEIAVGRFDWGRSDFFGLHGHPHSGGTMGPALQPWQRAMISGSGPFLPMVVGVFLFVFWITPICRRVRARRPRVDLWFSAMVAGLLLPGLIATPLYLLNIVTDGDWHGFISNVPGPLWLVHGLLWLAVVVTAVALWRLLPTLWKRLKAARSGTSGYDIRTDEKEVSAAKHLLVGGLVAMGFDRSGRFLLTVTHSGRGVFAVGTWERVARDPELAYPEGGTAIGIGPIDGEVICVEERDETREQINMTSPDGKFHLLGESDGITITDDDTEREH